MVPHVMYGSTRLPGGSLRRSNQWSYPCCVNILHSPLATGQDPVPENRASARWIRPEARAPPCYARELSEETLDSDATAIIAIFKPSGGRKSGNGWRRSAASLSRVSLDAPRALGSRTVKRLSTCFGSDPPRRRSVPRHSVGKTQHVTQRPGDKTSTRVDESDGRRDATSISPFSFRGAG